jgi:hypothetical protein
MACISSSHSARIVFAHLVLGTVIFQKSPAKKKSSDFIAILTSFLGDSRTLFGDSRNFLGHSRRVKLNTRLLL